MPASSSTLAIIQARMASSRLPDKVLLDIAGQPMLVRVVERTRRATQVSDVVVATTTDPADDAIAALCQQRDYPCYRGSMHAVLDRYYQAARRFSAELIVRITADCPLIDPRLIDEAVSVVSRSVTDPLPTDPLDADFVANRLPPPWQRTYPIGLDVEVCTFAALERAWREADQPFQREHVMPYFYEGIPPEALWPSHDPTSAGSYLQSAISPRGFHVVQLHHFPNYGHLRWTVDTAEDLELVRNIFARFPGRDDFTWRDILALFEEQPELAGINLNVRHKTAFDVDERHTS